MINRVSCSGRGFGRTLGCVQIRHSRAYLAGCDWVERLRTKGGVMLLWSDRFLGFLGGSALLSASMQSGSDAARTPYVPAIVAGSSSSSSDPDSEF